MINLHNISMGKVKELYLIWVQNHPEWYYEIREGKLWVKSPSTTIWKMKNDYDIERSIENHDYELLSNDFPFNLKIVS